MHSELQRTHFDYVNWSASFLMWSIHPWKRNFELCSNLKFLIEDHQPFLMKLSNILYLKTVVWLTKMTKMEVDQGWPCYADINHSAPQDSVFRPAGVSSWIKSCPFLSASCTKVRGDTNEVVGGWFSYKEKSIHRDENSVQLCDYEPSWICHVLTW